ncbi:hypothetical protein LCGC14_0877160 [marine sediment metagenome]|uniref:Uncharacterized protein n=1 Tax=marine sediment metagenome TaxID=412755 RepID=A0A0F9RML1_9ZZZZ
MTNKKKISIGKYEVIPFPKDRKVVIVILEQGIKKHYVKGLIEFDVDSGNIFNRVITAKDNFLNHLSYAYNP